MFLIRNICLIHTGRRDEAVGITKEMSAEIEKEFGAPPSRILTGSIGPSDSTLVMEFEVESLAQHEEMLEKVNNWEGLARYMPRFAEIAVPGTNRWEIYRIQ